MRLPMPVYIFAGVNLLNCGLLYHNNMTLPPLVEERSWVQEMALLSAIFLGAFPFGRLIGGWMTSKKNPRLTLHGCFLLLVVITSLYGVVRQPEQLMVLRLGQGVVQGVILSMSDYLLGRFLDSFCRGMTDKENNELSGNAWATYSAAGTISILPIGCSGLYLMNVFPMWGVYFVIASATAVLYVGMAWKIPIVQQGASSQSQVDSSGISYPFIFLLGLMGGGVSAVFTTVNSYTEPITKAANLNVGVVSIIFVGVFLLGKSSVSFLLVKNPLTNILLAMVVVLIGTILLWRGIGYAGIAVVALGFGRANVMFWKYYIGKVSAAKQSSFSIMCYDLVPGVGKWSFGSQTDITTGMAVLLIFSLASVFLFSLVPLGNKKKNA
jgi:MFS family permease